MNEGIIDPVSGFMYPADWVVRCVDTAALNAVSTGFAVLTSAGTVLKRGFTTGTTAAAAAMAAVLSLDRPVESVQVRLPCGLTATLPVTTLRAGVAVCRKYSGDYPSDVTSGLVIRAEAMPADQTNLSAGEGIGRYSRGTARWMVGEPAISTSAEACILQAIRDGITALGDSCKGASVTLSVLDGVAVASRTLNPQLGIIGGISLLGTTGLVEPWDDHLTSTIMDRVSGADRVVLTTGRIGLRYSRLLFPDHEVVLIGGKIREALDVAHGEVILCGLPGLILRYIDPSILEGTGCVTVEELRGTGIFVSRMEAALKQFAEQYPNVQVVLIERDGNIIGGVR
jgi:cobalt-precorrin-5B (C1)-methyltransferase